MKLALVPMAVVALTVPLQTTLPWQYLAAMPMQGTYHLPILMAERSPDGRTALSKGQYLAYSLRSAIDQPRYLSLVGTPSPQADVRLR